MCTLSYQKCVCFVFLVILAVLSSSGFRIDNLAMTDVSKRNQNSLGQTTGLPELFFAYNSTTTHRLRHRRQMLHDTRSRASRRSPECPEVDVSWKTYTSDAIALASVRSRSTKCKNNCTITFKVDRWLKKPQYNDDSIRIDFRTNKIQYCESDDPKANRPYWKNQNRSKTYILFLMTDQPHKYTAAYNPEQGRNKTIKTIVKFIDFKQKPPRLEIIPRNESHKRLRLQCRVRGFPIPLITWKVNNTSLHSHNRIRIAQKKKRSTLLIRNITEADLGQYECLAKSVNGTISKISYHFRAILKPGETTSRPRKKPGISSTVSTSEINSTVSTSEISSTVSTSDRPPCDEAMKVYCQNGGTCFYSKIEREYSCECPDGFKGRHCEEKTSNLSSTYHQTSLYTCTEGIYTNYDKC